MQENKIGPYSLGGIKSFKGHEGEGCLQGTLLLNGKKIAEWSEDSWGGPMHFHFKTLEAEKAFFEEANRHKIAVEFAQEMLKEYGVACADNNHADLVVSTIAMDLDLLKRQEAQLKRWCKTKIVFRLPGDTEGEYRTLNVAYSATQHDKEMERRFPGCEIINKRFL
ncbi:hypothetical protein [Azonexus hydrophilus]|uniref:Uncharacterized protein n=1 Tax=Azonexus hydrophilus TaxID=418702 RepID=A0ABZ2XL30_9RHOO